MSAKPVRKLPAKEAIMTRTKSAQNKRQLRVKDRSMKKITQLLMRSPPKNVNTKPVQKSPKKTLLSPTKVLKKSPLKTYEKKKGSMTMTKLEGKKLDMSTEDRKEFYPDKMKRSVTVNKVYLRPKHDYKVIERLNKRKWATPKLIREEPPKEGIKEVVIEKSESDSDDFDDLSQTSDLTIKDMIFMKDGDEMTDDDLMEILTCPSPVWWEDPPDEGYFEEPLFKVPKKTIRKKAVKKVNEVPEQVNAIVSELNSKISNKLSNIDLNSLKEDTSKNEAFFEKRSTLENLLYNIKNTSKNSVENLSKTVPYKNKPKSKITKHRNISECSGEDFISDSDALKDLENLDIPVENDQFNIVDNEIKEKSVLDELSTLDIPIENSDNLIRDGFKGFDLSKTESKVNEMSNLNKINSEIKNLDKDDRKIKDKKDCIVVYKIVETVDEEKESVNNSVGTEKPIEEVKKVETVQNINSVFKKIKNIKKRNNKKKYTVKINGEEIKRVDKKSIVVTPEKTVNYCLKCSCIFETKECKYCSHKSDENHIS